MCKITTYLCILPSAVTDRPSNVSVEYLKGKQMGPTLELNSIFSVVFTTAMSFSNVPLLNCG